MNADEKMKFHMAKVLKHAEELRLMLEPVPVKMTLEEIIDEGAKRIRAAVAGVIAKHEEALRPKFEIEKKADPADFFRQAVRAREYAAAQYHGQQNAFNHTGLYGYGGKGLLGCAGISMI